MNGASYGPGSPDCICKQWYLKNAHPSHLKDDIAEPIIGEITAVKEGEVESVVGLPWHGQTHVQPLLDLAHLDI